MNARFDSADAAGLAADGQSILSFAGLLGRERTLRQTLADPAMAAGAKRRCSSDCSKVVWVLARST